jgi:putative hemolysin
LRQAIRHLTGGGLLVVFPAGGVSHFQWKGLSVSDPKWNTGVARLVEIVSRRVRKLCIIPAFVEGANGLLFQALGVLHPRLRTALLARELLNKRKAHVCVRVGSAVSAEKLLAIPTDIERVKYLRWRTYLLARREEYKPRFSFPLIGRRQDRAAAPIATPIDPESLARDIRALPAQCLLARSGDLAVYIAGARRLPNVLAEIGRLREVTFRAVGEGTGAATDVDRFDFHYLHLFVWNEVRQEIVGAYRMAGADDTDVSDLYTATLFEYGNAFVRRLGPALELGRSFVRPEYQKGFAPLLLLWKGIGRYIAENPRYKVLFGPVSISNSYQALSRDLMVSFLEREASLSDWIGLVSTRNPFRRRRSRSNDLPRQGFGIEDLSDVVSDLEPSRTGIPVLLRQYLKLGGKLLGFNVDPRFSNALDGLIVVDLTKTEPKLLDRYLGAAEARAFLDYQKGSNRWNSQKAC